MTLLQEDGFLHRQERKNGVYYLYISIFLTKYMLKDAFCSRVMNNH